MLATRTSFSQDINAWCYPTTSTSTDVIAEAYENAVTFFENELSQSRRGAAWIRGNTSMNDVIRVVSQAQAEYQTQSKKTEKVRTSINAFASSIQHYGAVLDVLAQADPLHAGLAWGAIKFLLAGAKAHADTIALLTEAFAEVGNALERVSMELKIYQTDRMKEAVSRVYAHVLLFLRRAFNWYNKNRLLRAMKDVVRPFQFHDTIKGIKECVDAVDRNANTSSHAEMRLLRLALQAQDQKLHEMQCKMEQGQAKSEEAIKQLVQLHTNHYALSHLIKEDTGDMRPRIQDIQFHDILNVLRSVQLPEELLATCESYTRRGLSWRQPGRDTILAAQKLKTWVQSPGSSMFLVTAGPRAEPRTKALAVEVTKLLKDTGLPVFWYLSSPTGSLTVPTVSNVLKDLIFQALRHDRSIVSQDPRLGNIQAFQSQHNLTEWINLTILVLSKIRQFFVVVETDDLHRLHSQETEQLMMNTLARVFEEVVKGGSTMKLLSVAYGGKTKLATQPGQLVPLTVLLNGPLPAVRRKGPIMRQLQVGRGRHQLQPRLAAH